MEIFNDLSVNKTTLSFDRSENSCLTELVNTRIIGKSPSNFFDNGIADVLQFIYDMAQRFEISRKELNMAISKEVQTVTLPATNLALCKIVDRNARLAYDNSMLHFEISKLKKQLMEKNAEISKIQYLRNRTSIYTNMSNEDASSCNLQKYNKLKSSLSRKSGFSIDLQRKDTKSELAIRRSVTSLVERNKRHCLSQERVLDKKMQFTKFNDEQWGCLTEMSGLARTESAPELYTVRTNE